MLTKEMLKRLGILGVSLGLVASPLAFAEHHEEASPEAEATGSAANPEMEGDAAAESGTTHQSDSMMDESSPAAGATDSAADPMAEGDLADESAEDDMIMDEEGESSKAESTGSAADPTDE